MEKGRVVFVNTCGVCGFTYQEGLQHKCKGTAGAKTIETTRRPLTHTSQYGAGPQAHMEALQNENIRLQSELADLRDFVRSLRSIEFEDWHGHYSKREPLEFMIVEGDGEIVGKGKDCLAAWEALRKEA